LAELISIRSVSPDPACAAELQRAAEWVATRIRRAGGSSEIRPGAVPLVVGEVPASQTSAGDVLAYAHFDVQPAHESELWETDPFQLVERDGQLFGRGVADDKANLVILLHAVEQLARAGSLPVNVRFLIDGEEEVGGDSADEWLLADERGASVALMLDGSVDELTTGIRGMLFGHLRITTGKTEQHAGLYGGAALAATDALTRTLAAVLPGPDGLLPAPLRAGVVEASGQERHDWLMQPPGSELLADAGLRPADASAAADFHLRTRAEPAVTIHGIASGHATEYAATIPVEAHANFSVRTIGGQSARSIASTFEQLLQGACPAEAELEIEWRFQYDGASIRRDTPELVIASDAIERHFGRRPSLLRSGGSLPLFETLARRDIPVVSTGFAIEREAGMHGPNERFPAAHVDLGIATVKEILAQIGKRFT
jgi:acetylornithine deacetylase/succinyl-diaminopimelate desuccinylase-like protein